jgi:hypothetical protein
MAAKEFRAEGPRSGVTTSSANEASGGKAGDIVVEAGKIQLSGDGSVNSSANVAEAGSIFIHSATRIDLDGSKITVKSEQNNAGTVTLNAPDTILFTASEVSAQAGHNGGNISIDTDFMYQLGNSSITAISENQSAQQGTVAIRSGIDFANSLTALPSSLLTERNGLREGCARENPNANSLILRGKGGTAERPDGFLPAFDLRPATTPKP